MKSADNQVPPLLQPEIIDRGRGPEIKGTRITVYDILDYLLDSWSPDRIAAWFRISSRQVEAAVAYINEHTIEVLKEYIKILERCDRGNPPELQAKLDAGQQRFQDFVRQVREAQARGETNIPELIRKYREMPTEGNAHASDHGRS